MLTREECLNVQRPLGVALGQYLAEQCPDSEIGPRYARVYRIIGRFNPYHFDVTRGLLGHKESAP